MADKKERPLHRSGIVTESQGDQLNIRGVEIDHAPLQAEKKDQLLGMWQGCQFIQQRDKIGRVDKHEIFEAGEDNIVLPASEVKLHSADIADVVRKKPFTPANAKKKVKAGYLHIRFFKLFHKRLIFKTMRI